MLGAITSCALCARRFISYSGRDVCVVCRGFGEEEAAPDEEEATIEEEAAIEEEEAAPDEEEAAIEEAAPEEEEAALETGVGINDLSSTPSAKSPPKKKSRSSSPEEVELLKSLSLDISMETEATAPDTSMETSAMEVSAVNDEDDDDDDNGQDGPPMLAPGDAKTYLEFCIGQKKDESDFDEATKDILIEVRARHTRAELLPDGKLEVTRNYDAMLTELWPWLWYDRPLVADTTAEATAVAVATSTVTYNATDDNNNWVGCPRDRSHEVKAEVEFVNEAIQSGDTDGLQDVLDAAGNRYPRLKDVLQDLQAIGQLALIGDAWDFFQLYLNTGFPHAAYAMVIRSTFLPHTYDGTDLEGVLSTSEDRRNRHGPAPGANPFTKEMVDNALISKAQWDAYAQKSKYECAKRTMYNLICAAVRGCRVCSKPFTSKELTYEGANCLHGDHNDYIVKMGMPAKHPTDDPCISNCFRGSSWNYFLIQLNKIEITHQVCNYANNLGH